MAKFAFGEKVDNAADDHEVGTVIAVFLTVDGRCRCAVDTEGYGALQFFAEEKLVVHPTGPEWCMLGRATRPRDAGKHPRRFRGGLVPPHRDQPQLLNRVGRISARSDDFNKSLTCSVGS